MSKHIFEGHFIFSIFLLKKKGGIFSLLLKSGSDLTPNVKVKRKSVCSFSLLRKRSYRCKDTLTLKE